MFGFGELFKEEDSRIITDVKECTLSDDQKKLFNGFDEIGGDISRYADTMEWFKKLTTKHETIYASITILSKPSIYLFGGVKNEHRKEFGMAYKRINEKIESSRDSTEKGKNKAKRFIKDLVEQTDVMEVRDDCVVYVGPEKGTMDTQLTRCMALFNDSEISSFDDKQLREMRDVRIWWKGNFKLVNVTRMKRLALLYIEMCPEKILLKPAQKWINAHGGRPSGVTKFGKNENTQKILKEDIDKMMEDKPMWKKYKKVFKSVLKDTYLSNDETDITEVQKGFKDGMGDRNFVLRSWISPDNPEESDGDSNDGGDDDKKDGDSGADGDGDKKDGDKGGKFTMPDKEIIAKLLHAAGLESEAEKTKKKEDEERKEKENKSDEKVNKTLNDLTKELDEILTDTV